MLLQFQITSLNLTLLIGDQLKSIPQSDSVL